MNDILCRYIIYETTILIICFYNGKTKRIETYVKYGIVPLDVPIDCTYDQLLAMIYSRTCIDKERFKLVLTCKYPLKSGNMFQPYLIWDDNNVYQMLKLVYTFGMEEIELYLKLVRVNPQVNQLVDTYIDLLLRGNVNVEELDYGCEPSSVPVVVIDRCELYEDDEDYEDQEGDEDSDDESNGDVQADGHVSSFLSLHKLMENEQGRYISKDEPSCDVSNNLDLEDS